MSASDRVLPYGRQTIEDDDIEAVCAALRTELLTSGPLVEAFERAFADATGAAHVVACNSGTAALHLSTMALDLGPGDAAVVPATTFLATANVVRMTGAEVVFADVNPETGLLEADMLSDAVARGAKRGWKIRAAVPVHLNGRICDMPALAEVATKHGASLIEDACHALGAPQVGATRHSRAACFSTHPVKGITTGEGGLVTTGDAMLAARMRQLRNHGISRRPEDFDNNILAFESDAPNPWYYEMAEIGWNYRVPDVLCALGISQLKKLDRFWRRRCDIAERYDRLLTPLAPSLRPVPRGDNPHGLHLYAVLVNFGATGRSRAEFMRALLADGIGTQVHYIPVHRQPYYKRRYGEDRLTGADAYYSRCLSLPIFPAMTDDDIDHIAASLSRVLSANG
jgi:UDP-4-amino-4,6-dideoxy-N-acetyl-beta-L-altrosamine transaminase